MIHCGSSIAIVVVSLTALSRASGADYEDVVSLFNSGKYSEAAAAAEVELGRNYGSERWSQLKIRAELAEGRFDEALQSLEEGLNRSPTSIVLRLLGQSVFRLNSQPEEATRLAAEIERIILTAPQRFASPSGRVAVGRYFLSRGADAKKVLDQFFDIAIAQQPNLIEAYFATAELALDKEDDVLAAETLSKAPVEAKEDPYFHYLLARAYLNGDRSKSAEEIVQSLKINPRHVESLLLQADLQIDAEEYDEAAASLDRVAAVNSRHPEMWAYRAVIAHLKNESENETYARQKALADWASNPVVDHIIGRELSQKYRFAEGASAQRRALKFDEDFRPAKLQLCQDLLRLGEEDEGWRLAEGVLADDGYNVTGFNLVQLRDHLTSYQEFHSDHFIVRMEPQEAELYGDRVISLLEEAHKSLCAKYEVDIDGPVTVEIFPRNSDFAVRTFGMPGASGYLGVCFGPVITAISPAAQGESPTSWESVLWHEFCHTVTLTKTRNKMPRWLSEGISVFEEGERDSGWKTTLSPQFREMILSDDLTPLSELSSAFLAPKSGLHLQFAYFESALAVEFFVERYGIELVKGLLQDLGEGMTINDSLVRRSGLPLDALDSAFATYARAKALSVARKATWEEPEFLANADIATIEEWLESHPHNFWGLKRFGAILVSKGEWARAEHVLQSLITLYPEYVGPENPYTLLATVYRNTNRASEERSVLRKLIARDASQTVALLRLLEIDRDNENWLGLADNANRLLAVNPLIAAPHRSLATASEKLGEQREALAAYRAIALLDETDPAATHFKIAQLLHETGSSDEALREVLKSLEEAPRFREAHDLLLKLVETRQGSSTSSQREPVEAEKP